MAIEFLTNINLEAATDIQFKNAAGTNTGKIESDGNNLVLSNAVGDILLGDGASDIYIGDGTNSVDILFEVSGKVSAESGAELTLGGAGGTLALGSAISSAATILGDLTVGIDDAGHDVTFFGHTAGKKMVWDASADSMSIHTNAGSLGLGIFTSGVSTEPNFKVGRNANEWWGVSHGDNNVRLVHRQDEAASAGQLQFTSNEIWCDTGGNDYFAWRFGTNTGGSLATKMTLDKAGLLTVNGAITSTGLLTVKNDDGLKLRDTADHSASQTTLTSYNSSGNSQMKIKGGNYLHDVIFETSKNDFQYAKLNASYNGNDSSLLLYKSNSDTTSTAATTTISTGTSTFAGNVTAGSNSLTAGSLDINGDADISGDLTGVDTLTATTFSGDLNGTINTLTTAATQSASNNSTKVATTAYVDAQVATVVDSAPGTLNTLNELAAALGDDASFSTTVTNSIAAKLPLAGGTMSGAIAMGSQNITGAGTIAAATTITAGTTFIADAVDATNNDPGTDNLRVSGYGIIGNRDQLYFTNRGNKLVFGVGATHNGGNKLIISSATSAFSNNITSTGTITGTTLTGTSLDINGNADISGTTRFGNTVTIVGTNSTNAESVLLRGISSNDGDWLGSIRTANTGGYNQEMRFYTSNADGTSDEDLTLTLKPDQSATFAG